MLQVGAQVQTSRSKRYLGKITEMETITYATVYDGEEYMGRWPLHDIEEAHLTEEDAWIEVALMIGKETYYPFDDEYDPTKSIRHRAYQILGRNGIKITDEVKQRVRAIIERGRSNV